MYFITSLGQAKIQKWPNPTIFVEDIYGHFDILMSHYGQAKRLLPFRAMSKQCEFFTLQGVSNQVTHQTHPSTTDNDRHHPNTPPPDTIQTCPYTYWHQQKQTDTNKHQQTLPDILKLSHMLVDVGWKLHFDVSWCLLVCVGVFCCLEISRWCLGSCVGVYERCLWISKVFACVWGVI